MVCVYLVCVYIGTDIWINGIIRERGRTYFFCIDADIQKSRWIDGKYKGIYIIFYKYVALSWLIMLE